MGSTWAVGSIGVAPAGAVFPVGGQPVATVGAADDRPGAAGGLAGVAFAVELDDHVGAQGGVLLVAADPLIQLSRRPFTRWRAPGLRAANTGSKLGGAAGALAAGDGALSDGLGVAGRHAAEAVAREALRSDGQVVSSSAAAALTLPSCSARAKARSASPRSVRKRLGCQPSGWRSCPRPTPAPLSAFGGCCRRPTWSCTRPPPGCGCGRRPERG